MAPIRRCKNFTEREKRVVMDLVKQKISILENKKTDSQTNKLKQDAWDEVCQDFNAAADTGPRDPKQIKTLYENLKRTSRKKMPYIIVDDVNPSAMLKPQENCTPATLIPIQPAYTPVKAEVKNHPSVTNRLKPMTADHIKQQYFLKKLEIANFELKSKKIQHAMEMRIKKLQLLLLQKQNKQSL